MSASKIVLLLLTAASALVMQHYYGLMPDPMASHFDGSGRPNGYQSKDGFFLLSAALLVGNLLIFAAFGPMLRKIPTSWVNLPNRDYWLSPGRREETIGFMARQMDWFGVATVLLLATILALACIANLDPEPNLDSASAWWLLGGYVVFSTVWLVRLVTRFHRPSAG